MARFENHRSPGSLQLPDDWRMKYVGDLFHLVSGMHLGPEDYNRDGDGWPYFTGPTDYTNELENVTKWTDRQTAAAKSGDVLLTVKGSGVGSLFPLKLERISIGRQIMALRGKRDSSAEYIYYCLCEKVHLFRQLAKGNMIPGLTRSDILKQRIPVPPLPEQKAIAHVLALMDKAIETNNRLIAQKEFRKQWLMHNLLTGEKRFKGFTGEWRKRRLDEVITLISRPIAKPTENFLALGIRSHGKGTFLKQDFVPEKIEMDTLYIVRDNDLILNITFAWEGAIAIVGPNDDGALVSHRFPTFTFLEGKGDVEFFRHFILQPRLRYMLGVISPGGAGRNRVLDKKDFLRLEFVLPGIEEQSRIGELLSTADAEIRLLRSKTENLRQQKKGLMQRLLTGKTRLKSQETYV